MQSAAVLAPAFAFLAGLGVCAINVTRPTPPPADPPRVRLAVLIVFDQMRGDYLARWSHLFGSDGFHRLTTDGAWFTDCHYPYGVTTTGPGHASILSGTSPDRHGIVNNNWYENGKDTYCATTPARRLDPEPILAKDAKPPEGGSPERLLCETVADVLKRTHGPNAKVFGLSLKDRSAILPTGQSPDGAFWFNGQIVTSTYYTQKLGREFPKWIRNLNETRFADNWFKKSWDRYRPDLDYARYSGPDAEPGEGAGTKQGRTFPHDLTAGLSRPGKDYYAALANSPFGNEMLATLAKHCITVESLGQDDIPDLLVVSFSSNDLIGHTWGPDSQEVLDVTLRSDAMIASLLRFLDAKVGRDRYLLGLTADHGITPLPEVSRAKGRRAERVNRHELQKKAEAYLRDRFGAGPAKEKSNWIEAVSLPWVYLSPKRVAQSGATRAEVARSLADYLGTLPELERAFSRFDPPVDDLHRRMLKSFHPARCGDVCVVLHPLDLPGGPDPKEPLKLETGTTHGSPYRWDTHVPLIAFGPGIRGGVRREPVTPQAMATIFSNALRIPSPASAEYPLPATLFAK
ncbi:MAG: alkaline phosphatase family protein [Gemmataceae bacterium]